MKFLFTEDQEMFRDSVRGLLEKECTADVSRGLWETESGRSSALWSKLGELGLLGLTVPEDAGGLAMNEIDLVLPLVEAGYAALAEPLVETVAVGAPLLADLGGPLSAEWLPRVAAGEAVLTVGHERNGFAADAHIADLLLLQRGSELHAVPRSAATLTHQPSSDPARKLFRVDWNAGDATRVADGEQAQTLLARAFDRGALASAAQLVGLAQRMVDIAVEYATQREQFGKPIGSFQAIKHMLATVQIQIEFVRPLLARAAYSVAHGADTASADVSQAKATAGEAATAAAKTALQVHGAIGYTWECDLQIWMKRAWSLELAWGSSSSHRASLADAVIDGVAPVRSFGYSPRIS